MRMNMEEDFLKIIKESGLSIDDFNKSSVLITGATGLIGSILTKNLLALNDIYGLHMKLNLLVRNSAKLDLNVMKNSEVVRIITGDITNLPVINEKIDYIIHGASITASKMMVENPVEVIQTNLIGTINMLELAKKCKVKSMIYLSTMEAYGFTTREEVLTEDNVQYLNPLALRSSYPESKRMSENLCVAYANEYSVPVKIIRLAQTFGRGVKSDDTRVFAEFARCAREKKDIILLTDGASKRMYLDTIDASTAIITVLLMGENSVAYNAANKDTYCSIQDMAHMVAKEIAGGDIEVKFANNDEEGKQFSPPHKLFLEVSKIEKLGWKPMAGLKEMYMKMMEEWKSYK